MARGWVELAHAPEIEPVPLPAEGWPLGAEIRVLSRDTDSGALTGLLRLPPGYRRGPGHLKIESEFFLLSGRSGSAGRCTSSASTTTRPRGRPASRGPRRPDASCC